MSDFQGIRSFLRAACLVRCGDTAQKRILEKDVMLVAALFFAREKASTPAAAALRRRLGRNEAELLALLPEFERLLASEEITAPLDAEHRVRTFIKEFEARIPPATMTDTASLELRFAEAVSDYFLKKPASAPGLPLVALGEQAGPILNLPTIDANIEDILIGLENPLYTRIALLGERGSGKSFLIDQLAARVREGKVPDIAKNLTIWKLDTGHLLSKMVGETANRLRDIFDFLSRQGESLLFIDEFQGLAQAGGNHAIDHMSVLKDLLTSREFSNIKVIVATTKHEYDTYVRVDKALERRFNPFQVRQPDRGEERQAVEVQVQPFFKEAGCPLSPALIDQSLSLARLQLPSRPPIATAISILAGAHARVRHTKGAIALEDALAQEATRQATGSTRKSLSLQDRPTLREALTRKLVGQPHVVNALLDIFSASALGIGPERGPRAAVLFAGPPGTGKTHAARLYSEALGAEFLHLHMAEFSQDHDCVPRLIGFSPSFVNAEQGGQLVNPLRDNPDTIVLLDEIDQAHPSVINLLYRALDEGFIVDGFGNRITMRTATFFLTTNLGTTKQNVRSRPLGFGASESVQTASTVLTKEEVLESVKDFFPSAFLSRLTHAYRFEPLGPGALARIATQDIARQSETISKRLGRPVRVEKLAGPVLVGTFPQGGDARAIIRDLLPYAFWGRVVALVEGNRRGIETHAPLSIDVLLDFVAPEPRILLLDDHPQDVAPGIPRAGISVDAPTCTADSAARHVRQHDLVLLDLDWGHGPSDGLKVLDALRNAHPDIPVVLYTGLGDHDLKAEYFRHGATAFVDKADGAALQDCLTDMKMAMLMHALRDQGYRGVSFDCDSTNQGEIRIIMSPSKRCG